MNIWKDIAICSVGYIVGMKTGAPYYRRGYSMKERIKDILERKLNYLLNGEDVSARSVRSYGPVSYAPVYRSFRNTENEIDSDESEDSEEDD